MDEVSEADVESKRRACFEKIERGVRKYIDECSSYGEKVDHISRLKQQVIERARGVIQRTCKARWPSGTGTWTPSSPWHLTVEYVSGTLWKVRAESSLVGLHQPLQGSLGGSLQGSLGVTCPDAEDLSIECRPLPDPVVSPQRKTERGIFQVGVTLLTVPPKSQTELELNVYLFSSEHPTPAPLPLGQTTLHVRDCLADISSVGSASKNQKRATGLHGQMTSEEERDVVGENSWYAPLFLHSRAPPTSVDGMIHATLQRYAIGCSFRFHAISFQNDRKMIEREGHALEVAGYFEIMGPTPLHLQTLAGVLEECCLGDGSMRLGGWTSRPPADIAPGRKERTMQGDEEMLRSLMQREIEALQALVRELGMKEQHPAAARRSTLAKQQQEVLTRMLLTDEAFLRSIEELR